MPKSIQSFAKSALTHPVQVNVGRAGAANLNIIQHVELIEPEQRYVALLVALKKTPPPALIFSESKTEADAIYEYLLLKGIKAVAVHGGKDQVERTWAIDQYRSGKKDVLVATDIASKGLDFPEIQHVINFDMPKEIENYIHRIGRTGRGRSTGFSTTFVNKRIPLTVLLDLKHLLLEGKQRIPAFLAQLDDPDDVITKPCEICDGLGHRPSDCPKLLKNASRNEKKAAEFGKGYSGGGGDW